MLKRYHIIRRCFSYNLESDTVDKFLRVALVGRPNTGKSTLFNRLTKSNFAIVSPIPGTTRDRNVAKGDIAGLNLIVTDTGGLDDRGHIHENVQSQVDQAIKSSDVILFLVDAKEGVTSLDSHFANWIRRRLSTKDRPSTDSSSKSNDVKLNKSVKKEVLLLANKTEGAHLSDRVLDTISDVLQLGLGDPILISASHGDGMADLAHSLIEIAKSKGLDTENVVMEKGKKPKISLEERVIEMAIMGKPNVGKSSLINAILKEERVIVGPTPGLTRYICNM
jgi:GTP-binding protein